MAVVPSETKDHKTDLKETLNTYLAHWKWFAVSIVLCVALAFIYLRYATPNYAAEAKIQILDEKNAPSSLDLFGELDFLNSGNSQVQDEIQIINSRSNFIEVVKELGLNTKIYEQGNITESEIYRRPPLKLNFIAADSVINKADYSFFVTMSSTTTFGFQEEEDAPTQVMAYGRNVSTPIGDIVITPNVVEFDRYLNKKFRVVVEPITVVAESYQKEVTVFATDEFSNIVKLTLKDPIKEKARDILNSLIRIYNSNAIEDKRIIADRTSDFINERIADISSSLSTVDQSAQDLKTSRGLTDISSEANINLNIGASNRQELANFQTQLNIASSMKDILDEQDGYDVLPSNIGLNDPTIASTTEKYNQLVLERQRLLKSSTEKSPIIRNIDEQLESLRQNMESSLSSTVNNLGMQVNTLSNQQAIINSKIYSAPKNERALRDITRQQQTTESLYLYLLQKREEAQIAVASTNPKSKIIDRAYTVGKKPVSPKKPLVLLASLLLGLLIPFSVIYGHSLIDNKIHNMQTLERITRNVPILGELPKLAKGDSKIVTKHDRSVLAESLRILRTNLDYLIRTKKGGGKSNRVFVTSSVPGEGKTFLSSNLSIVLASTGKKVLLVGADIRNPKITSFFKHDKLSKEEKRQLKTGNGLTEYLFDAEIQIEDIINNITVNEDSIDLIYSGRVPPNPSELLLSERFEILMKEVSEIYDYVIVDTAPLMVVSDTLLITAYSDHLIYVTRAGVTEKTAIDYPIKLLSEGKIKGLTFVVNDVKAANLGYGGKYGYGYGKSQKQWWRL